MYVNSIINIKFPVYTRNNFIGFGKKQANDEGDKFECSNYDVTPHIKHHRYPPISDELKQLIIEHYKQEKRYGDIKAFCAEHNLQKFQYQQVIKEAGIKPQGNTTKKKQATPITDEMKQQIIEHYNNPNRKQGDVKKFCEEKGIFHYQYQRVLDESKTTRRTMGQTHPPVVRKRVYVKKNSRKGLLDKELVKKVIEHYTSAEHSGGFIKDFCDRHNIKKGQYAYIVHAYLGKDVKTKLVQEKEDKKAADVADMKKQREIGKVKLDITATKAILAQVKKIAAATNHSVIKEKNLSRAKILEEKIRKLEEKIQRIKDGLPVEEEQKEENKHLLISLYMQNKLNNICGTTLREISSNTQNAGGKEFSYYVYTQKNDILRILKEDAAGKTNLTKIKNALEKVKEELTQELSKYSQNHKESNTLNNMIKFVDGVLGKAYEKLDIVNMTATKLPNQKWFVEKDFDNRIFGHEGLAHIYSLSNDEQKAFNEINQKLKVAFPDDTVIFLQDYDSFKLGGESSQEKYTVKYRIYKSPDGRRTGYFGTNKVYTMEFVSTWKDAYRTFIETLIKQHQN